MNNVKKTLGMKCSQEFYDQIMDYINERGMTVSNLIRMALKQSYGLEEKPVEKRSRCGLPE